ncbi:MAG: hypothetical protein CMM76_04330 [Rhodospirillaceae bacterium]|nr:hypothetical protein [Rhodospirillaceae bacterium]|tara:strand:+ start:1267 stop:1542 length:276 start_codon:yes stop_codon:yes gene_type:complete
MKRPFLILAIFIAQYITTPVFSKPQTPQEQASELADQGMKKLIQALQLMLTQIPQYEAPFVNEYGDIIIRRKNPKKLRPDEQSQDGPGHNI